MRATSVLSLLFLILGHILLPAFATPVGQDAPMQIKRGFGMAEKLQDMPPIYQTISPPAPSPTPAVNSTTSGNTGDPASDTQSNSDSKALNSVNAGVTLAPRETLFFSVLGGVIATSLMF